MEMVLQQRAAGGGCRLGPRPAASTAPSAKHEQEQEEVKEAAAGPDAELRRGPWTVDEDLTLINYIAEHGEGRWNALARAAGLNRTGKSCRLRWLNYLRPDVKRGDFTADEQLLILDLHSRWGNRWSKIASHLPGRTDNEIKNYWRTRVQKHAKQLNCDVNSARFKDAMRFLWMPRLAERAAAAQSSSSPASPAAYLRQQAISGDGHGLGGSALMTMTNGADRSPSSVVTTTSSPCSSRTSSGSTATVNNDDYYKAAAPAGGDDWAAIQRDQEFWSTASNLQQLAAGGDDQQLLFPLADLPMMQDLSGWVQGFSEGAAPETHQLWSLDDIWRMH
ncbi:hypothetical protein PAHAL_8G262700 [Panicum hallii]|uniref:Uncharacterized protein n=1 Tax=Panicum hallii TaxID=206008 RepID=A0A2S3IFS2_9POAL|nr:transcription factor JAMYB-like [Panicum hallii]PAN43779.1 hypothetical protein PAHAL_8G262700 [Panicum hallii]